MAMAQTPSGEILLRAENVWKAFGRTVALAGAQFELRHGEVHALVGANGAGKSTLSRIISGHLQPERGSIRMGGQTLKLGSARDGLTAGIAIVMQETSLAPDLSILENICLPELGTPGRLSWRKLRQDADRILDELGQSHDLPLDMPVRDLTIGQRQLIEIAKALALDSRIIIFDEPTASFSPREVDRLFDVIRLLASRDKAIVFVSHRLEEIFAITDRITVLREGKTVAEAVPAGQMSATDLVRTMVGRELTDIYAHKGATGRSGPSRESVVLEVERLAARPLVRDVSFRVHRGEILGLAGLVGAGRSDAVEAIFGLRRIDGGHLRLDGKPFRPTSPIDAIRAGIGFIPEDRRGKGLVPDLSVRENLLLASMGRRHGIGTGYRQNDAAARQLLETLELPPDRVLDNNVLNLSGGMQQKVVLARWLLLEPKLLILDEPTRGVDIGTRSTIYGLLREVAAAGAAVIVISSDFEEVLGLADRIVVVSDGVDVTDIPSAYLDVEKLAMFAAPRTSAEATHRTLEALAGRFGGTAFWLHLEHARVYCFDSVAGGTRANPGFAGGTFPSIEETAIPKALTTEPGRFVVEPDGTLATVLFPVTTERGHDLGYIGLTVRGGEQPDAAPIGMLVEEMTGQAASHLI